MSLRSLIVVLTVTLCRTSCKKILCQMVSVETDDGLSGYCCVIFRNMSEINLQEEEVKQQILDSFRNSTDGDITPRLDQKDDDSSDAVNFPTEDYSDSEIKFPETSESGDLRNVSSEDRKIVPESAGHNSTISNVTSSGKETIIGFAVNRNAVDTPETCPQGSDKDVNGDCVPVF